ncbi:MAG: PAS domain S-box protein [Chloroflexi bacterium]|nr:PAS domain S-box protein [Chloroflexota bacterium]
MTSVHRLLQRQLKRHLNGLEPPSKEWRDFIQAVNDAYVQADEDRQMLEHSLELTSQELLRANSQVLAVFKRLIESSVDGIFAFDLECRYTVWNPGMERVTGVSPLKTIGKNAFEVFPELKETGEDEFFHEALAGKIAVLHDKPYSVPESGQTGFVEAHYSPLFDEAGEITGGLAIIRDITERKKGEEILAYERDQLQSLMDNIPDSLYFKDTASRFTRINRAQAAVLGVDDPQEALGKTDFDFQTPELSRVFFTEEQKIVQTGQPIVDRAEFNPTRDGQPRWFLATKVPIFDAEGRVTGIVGISRNITEYRKGEEALKQAEARYRSLFEGAPVGLYRTTPAGQIVDANPAIIQMMGYPDRESYLRLGAVDLYDIPDDRKRWEALMNRDGLVRDFEARVRRSDGAVIWVRDSARAVRDAKGHVLYYEGSWEDISQRKQAEEALQEANANLARGLDELRQRNREIALLNEMGDLLQTCRMPEEAYAVIANMARQLFPEESGALYVMNASRNLVDAVASWGLAESEVGPSMFEPDNCWALRRSRTHIVEDSRTGLLCRHVDAASPAAYLCVPMMAQGEALGVFHLRHDLPAGSVDGARTAGRREAGLAGVEQRLAQSVADSIALAIANLNLRESLRQQSIRDPLTGLFNRRYLEETMLRETHRAERNGHPLGIIMLDLDHFKRFNDTFGHGAGDMLLREVGTLLQSHVRGEDIACRYGGEEFTLIMPEASMEVTRLRAERMREEAKRAQLQFHGQLLGAVTLSAGVAIFPEHGSTPEAVIRAADAALYRAKREGRDRVVVGQ